MDKRTESGSTLPMVVQEQEEGHTSPIASQFTATNRTICPIVNYQGEQYVKENKSRMDFLRTNSFLFCMELKTGAYVTGLLSLVSICIWSKFVEALLEKDLMSTFYRLGHLAALYLPLCFLFGLQIVSRTPDTQGTRSSQVSRWCHSSYMLGLPVS